MLKIKFYPESKGVNNYVLLKIHKFRPTPLRRTFDMEMCKPTSLRFPAEFIQTPNASSPPDRALDRTHLSSHWYAHSIVDTRVQRTWVTHIKFEFEVFLGVIIFWLRVEQNRLFLFIIPFYVIISIGTSWSTAHPISRMNMSGPLFKWKTYH